MGIWRFAGAFAVVKRQGECGSKTAEMHVSQPMNIGVCYGLGAVDISLFSSCRLFQNVQSQFISRSPPKKMAFLSYMLFTAFVA